MRVAKILGRLILGLSLLGTAPAQSTTWNGSTSSNWFSAANWSAGVPTSTTTAIIGSRGLRPMINAGGAACLDLQTLGTLTIDAGRRLSVSGSVNLQADVLGDGALALVGGGAARSLTMAPGVSAGTASLTGGSDVSVTDVTFRVDLAYSGTGRLLWGGTIGVGRNLILTGQEVVMIGGVANVTVGGDATLSTTATMLTPFTTLSVADDLTAGASFRPSSGEIVFTGNTAHAVSSASNQWASIRLAAGSLSLPSASVNGSLVADPGATLSLTDLGVSPVGPVELRSATPISARNLYVWGGQNALVTLQGIDFEAAEVRTARLMISGRIAFGSLLLTEVSSLLGGASDTLVVDMLTVRDSSGIRQDAPGTMQIANMIQELTTTFNSQNSTVVFTGGGVTTQRGFTAGRVEINGSLDQGVTLSSAYTSSETPLFVFGTLNVNSGLLRVNAFPVSGQPSPPVGLLQADTINVAAGASLDDSVGLYSGTVNVAGTASLAAVGTGQNSRFAKVTRLVVSAGGSVAVKSHYAYPNQALHIVDDLLVDGALTWFPGAKILHTGTGTVRSASLPALDALGVACTVESALIQGDFTHSAGSLAVDQLTVTGDASVTGTTLVGSGAASRFTVNGTLALQTTGLTTTPPARIECVGSWTSNANFAPTSGTVAFVGAGAQAVTFGPPPLHDVEIGQTARVTLVDLDLGGGLTVAGILNLTGTSLQAGGGVAVPGQLLVGNATVTAPGVLLVPSGGIAVLGGGTHALGSLDVAGLVLVPAAATFEFTGGGMVRATSQLPHVRLMSGSYDMPQATIRGDLLQEPGCASLALGDVDVAGSAVFRGGTVSATAGVQDVTVAGDLRMETSADVVTPPALITCEGDWFANARFVPTVGCVRMAGPTTEVDHVDPGGTCRFFEVAVVEGVVTAQDRIECTGPTCTIEAGATLDVRSRRLTLAPGSIATVNGTLGLEQGGTILLLSGAEARFGLGSTLRAHGRPTNRAGFAGVNAGVELAGLIEAQNAFFSGLDARGVRILASATLAAAPYDLRGVRVDSGSALAGARLVDAARSAGQALELWDWELVDNVPTTYGVASNGLGRVDLINASGGRAGEAFELDPNGVVSWSERRTQIASHSALGSFLQNRVRFATTREIAMNQLRLSRAPTSTGPWVVLTTFVPQGNATTGASYSYDDTAVLAGEEWFYRGEERLLHDVWRPLFDDRARTFPSQVGDTALVGPGAFATIDAALAAIPVGGNVVVGAGLHAPFTITRPAHVFGAGSGATQIVGANAVLITGLAPTDGEVSLQGLTIGDGATAGAPELVRVAGAGNVVLLDDLELLGAPGQDALRLVGSRQVKLQKIVANARGVFDASTAYAARSVFTGLDLRNGAHVTHAATTPGAVTRDATSTETVRAGGSPRVEGVGVWQADETVPLTVSGTPGHVFGLMLDARLTFLDLSFFLPLDMVLMLPAPVSFATGLVPPTGEAELTLMIPEDIGLHGHHLALQVFAVDLATASGRFGSARLAVILP